MDTLANKLRDIGVFLLVIGVGGVAFFPIFSYIHGFIKSGYMIVSIIGPSCSILDTVINLTYWGIVFLLITFVYRKWFR